MILLIDSQTAEDIAAVVQYANDHPYSLQDMKELEEGVNYRPIAGNIDEHCVLVPNGYRCVYSIESDKQGRMTRHLSISLYKATSYPSPDAMDMLMSAFEFANDLAEGVFIYPDPNVVWAINVVEYLENTPDE